jgi:hypothetical protein
MNCRLVVFADTLAETVIVPETVVPATGDVMVTVAAEFLTSAPVTLPAQLAQSSPSNKIKHTQATAPGWTLDLPMSLVHKLIQSFLSFLKGRCTGVGPYIKGIPHVHAS